MPDFKGEVRARLAPLGLDPQRETNLVDELAAHMEDAYAEARGRNLDDAAARAVALTQLDGIERFAPDLRRGQRPAPPAIGASRGSRLETLVQDVRYALRTFRTHPAFAVVVVATFALGIGACTLVFSAVNGVIRRPLPYPEPERLVTFFGTAPEKGLPEVAQPLGMFVVYRDRNRTLERITAYNFIGRTLTGGGGDPEQLDGAIVSRDFFATLGVPPARGRAFVDGEDAPNVPQAVVISHALWQRRFGGDTTLVGHAIELSSRPATVVGIMPPGFDFPSRAQFWLPLVTDGPDSFDCWCFQLLGRTKPGVDADDVAREMAALTDDFGLERRDIFPNAKQGGAHIIAMPLTRRIVGNLERPLYVLLGAVGFVLLIACANVANLVMVRAASRRRELAMRSCLGAGPGRIATQLLTESLVLSAIGAAAGFGLAYWGMQLMRRLPADRFPRIDQVGVDPSVLAFTALIAVGAGLLCGVAPALRVRRLQLHDAVRSGARGTGGPDTRRWSDGFAVTQFALSLVLLIGAALLLRSYQRLSQLDLGYSRENVWTGRLSLPFARYDTTTRVRAFYEALVQRVEAIPGVTNVGLASLVPLRPGNTQNNVVAEGQDPRPGEPVRVANARIVTPGYFQAIGTRLIEGRDFTSSDDARSMRTAIVDEAFARHFWPEESAIGKRVREPSDSSANPWVTIVGVVQNVKHNSLDEATDIQFYESFPRHPTWSSYLVVRSAQSPTELTARIRTELRALDPLLPLSQVRTMADAVDESLGIRRLTNVLLGGFAVTALLLAAIGIYGVISLSVTARVREFGVRMALGAKAADIRRMVLRYGLGLAIAGVVIGGVGALYLTRFIRKLLFGVEPNDPVIVAGVAVTLVATAVLACWIPARRAMRSDPMLALRSD